VIRGRSGFFSFFVVSLPAPFLNVFFYPEGFSLSVRLRKLVFRPSLGLGFGRPLFPVKLDSFVHIPPYRKSEAALRSDVAPHRRLSAGFRRPPT